VPVDDGAVVAEEPMPVRPRPSERSISQYLSRVADDDFTIKLTRDQALVLSDWLDRMMGTSAFDGLVNQERAVWSPLYTISGALETSLAEIFIPDYSARLDNARERLLASLGEIGRPAPEQ
jgi:hypothetical protein